ncbi:MAG: hypothetical protein OEZ51_13735 [Nitrospinota bacterium]|nr:hypothetical protein [Nitrospinota bacterium]
MTKPIKINIDSWKNCSSRSEVDELALKFKGFVLDTVITEGANTWGFLTVDYEGKSIFIPIGYANAGLVPEVVLVFDAILIGINEKLIGIDIEKLLATFIYRLPTIFHEFIEFNETNFTIRDETGFICLSYQGMKIWEFIIDDIIETFEIQNDVITGHTFEGKEFQFKIP